MLDVNTLTAKDLKGLSKGAVNELALAQLAANGEQLSAQQAALQTKDAHIARRDREIKFKDAKIERITFELARLKSWKFGAKTEAMSAEQRQLFEATLAEDEADLDAQLKALKGEADQAGKAPPKDKRQPRRQALPEHLRRVEHHHEPENTTCDCGKAMVRIGEDVSERLDIVPAEFFVHRHIRGKWACKCCERLVQEPVDPQIIDKGVPTAGLVAHTLVAHL
jgi:small-conductance mechanosensitive channel